MYPLIIGNWNSRWSHKVSTGGGYNDIFYGLELLKIILKKDTTVQNEGSLTQKIRFKSI